MAAPFQNYSGGTFLSDIVTRPEFLAYVSEAIYEQSAMLRSGAVVRDASLDARAGGVKVEVPTWKPIAPTEERIESNATWGTSGKGYLTPQKITAGKQTAPILHRGFSYAVDDLSRLGSGTDPMAAIRGYLADAINKLKMATVLSQLDGLFATAYKALETDVSADVAPTALTAANYLSAASAIAAKSKLGERADRLSVIVMHSSCYFYLQQVGMLTFSSDSLSSGKDIKWGGGGVGITNDQIAYFAGMRVIVDDNIKGVNGAGGTAGNALKYPVYMLAQGAIAEGTQQELRIEADRNILSLQDVITITYHYGYHAFGSNYTGADNPANSVLATAGSWANIYTDIRNFDIVRLFCNSPFGGVTP
jgi:hypothetical protein